MVFLLVVLVGLVGFVILLFSSKTFSPIPYFPSQPIDMPLIIKALNLKNNQTIFDLGAGDGIVIFKAAQQAFEKKLNTQFVAVEINPVLILILHLRRLFHPNKQNIKIIQDDIFKIDFLQPTMKQLNNVTIYLYISPWFLEKTISNIKNQMSKFSVVSYMYEIKSLKKKEEIIQGKNKIFVYE